jgi:thiamine biosynthesis lipoprotein
MKHAWLIMGMPVSVEIIDPSANEADFAAVFEYFTAIDERFSTYKETSEITKINKGLLDEAGYSADMKTVLTLSEETRQLTNGYFDIRARDGRLDPSGLVKGWAIQGAADLLKTRGRENFFVDVGGDIQACGLNARGEAWKVGIRNPFDEKQIVKVVNVSGQGVATSGTSMRGQHIYDPFAMDAQITDIVSLTVVGPNIYEADRFATAAFAMGKAGISFIENLPGFEGYMIDKNGIATMTSRFARHADAYV